MARKKKKWIKGALGVKKRRRGYRAKGYTPKLHHHRGHRKSVRVEAAHKGALHRYLGIPEGEKIPLSVLQHHKTDLERVIAGTSTDSAQHKRCVKHLRQINFALTARKKFKHARRKRSGGARR